MSKHIFNLRMAVDYGPTENEIASLQVDVLNENEWETLELNTTTPGFLIFVYSIFTCQHMFLRTNATERKLAFKSSRAELLVETSEDWLLEKVYVKFIVKLSAGEANDDDTDYIVSRMQHCPVSKNLPQGIDIDTSVEFYNG
jgi:uncharacterized OsmC-like protein